MGCKSDYPNLAYNSWLRTVTEMFVYSGVGTVSVIFLTQKFNFWPAVEDRCLKEQTYSVDSNLVLLLEQWVCSEGEKKWNLEQKLIQWRETRKWLLYNCVNKVISRVVTPICFALKCSWVPLVKQRFVLVVFVASREKRKRAGMLGSAIQMFHHQLCCKTRLQFITVLWSVVSC